MTLNDLEIGITSYCETVIAPQIQSTLDRFLFYGWTALIAPRLEKLIQPLIPVATNMGLIDAEGNIDLDALEKAGMTAFERQPEVTVWKFKFRREDFADFIRHLRG